MRKDESNEMRSEDRKAPVPDRCDGAAGGRAFTQVGRRHQKLKVQTSKARNGSREVVGFSGVWRQVGGKTKGIDKCPVRKGYSVLQRDLVVVG